jgi:hypothetical protein
MLPSGFAELGWFDGVCLRIMKMQSNFFALFVINIHYL